MKEILLGYDSEGKPIYLSPELRSQTHTHVIGSSGRGKSKFLEWMIRQDIDAGHGLCVIDWHGTLCNSILEYCAQLNVGLPHFGIPDHRSVIVLDPSKPDFVTGFNPFMNSGPDISTQVTRRIKATIRPWGVTNTNDMPTFEFVARLLYTFMAETGHTLPDAANLFDPEQRGLREYAIKTARNNYTRQRWKRLQKIKSERDWEDKVLSIENRLARFIGSTGVRRFMGLCDHNIDLMDIMDRGKILLVNLGASDYLDEEAARVFASLFLYEFMHTALRRANRSRLGDKPNHYMLYLDEFQEYITDDIAAMLEQVRKGGLHMILAHQHLSQLVENGNERLKESIFTNCRVKAVFGGITSKSADELAAEMFLPELNSRQIKATYEHTIHLYNEETRTQRSRSTAIGEAHGEHWSDGDSFGRARTESRTKTSGSGHNSGRSVTGSANQSEITSVPANVVFPYSSNQGVRTNVQGVSGSSVTSSSDSSFEGQSSGEAESEIEQHTHSVGGSSMASRIESSGETVVPFLRPIPVREKTMDVEWTIEEKRSRVSEIIINQPQRHCFIKLDTAKTQAMTVGEVKESGLSESGVLEYLHEIYEVQGALRASDVDQRLEQSEREFLQLASDALESSSHVEADSTSVPDAPSLTTPVENRSAIGIWDRAELTTSGPAANQTQRRRGPRTNIQRHARIAELTRRFGETWRAESSLQKICGELDLEGVASSDKWIDLDPNPASTWAEAFVHHRDRVVKAIEYSLSVVNVPRR